VLFFPSSRLGILGIILVAVTALDHFVPGAWRVAGFGLLMVLAAALTDLAWSIAAYRGRLRLERDFPEVITVTRPRRGHHVFHNATRIPVRVQVHEDSTHLLAKEYSRDWHRVAPGAHERWPLHVTGNERGEQHLGGAGLRAMSILGLWILQYRMEWERASRVYPLIEELTRGDLFAHRRRLYSLGQYQSRKFGRGTEFERLREYSPDDEYRMINWKATARAGKPIVNEHRVEQSRDLMLLIDCGRLMHTQIAGRPRLDRYLDAAVQLAYIALSQKDRVGLIAFDAEVRRFVAPGRGPRQLDDLIDAMFDLKPRFVESDYARAVTTLRRRQPKRGLAVLFTDLVDSVSSRLAVANLNRLARTHLPLVVILDDPEVEQLAAVPAAAGRNAAVSARDAFVAATAEQFIEEKRRTVGKLRSGGCLIVHASAARLNAALVDQYLQVKARNLL
jgi:uncharacterized protein (DUF58 family)